MNNNALGRVVQEWQWRGTAEDEKSRRQNVEQELQRRH